jgi:predicted PurR-regulated permease PerM
VFVAYQLAREAGSAADQMDGEAPEAVLRQKMEAVPVLSRVVAWMDRVGLDVEREVRKVVAAYTQDATGLLRGSVGAIVQLLVAVFVLYYFFRDRAALLQGVRALLPMSRADSDRVFAHVADSVHASLYATLVTALISAGTGGLMFWLLGLPSPVLWGVVMFVLSVLPIVGTALVWVPAAAYLVLTGRWPEALALTAWGAVCFVVVDTFLYMRLAGDRMRLHQVPVLIAFLGGLAVFGVSGMILGPAILAVTVALLEVWKKPTREALAAPPAAGAAAGP